jgi:hypothetical protein
MVPARQLRDKYCMARRDVYRPGEPRREEEDDGGDERGPGGSDGGGGPSEPSGPDGGPQGAGRRRIPGIDMSSLD